MSVTSAELSSIAPRAAAASVENRPGLVKRLKAALAAETRRSQDRYALAMIPTGVGRETGVRC